MNQPASTNAVLMNWQGVILDEEMIGIYHELGLTVYTAEELQRLSTPEAEDFPLVTSKLTQDKATNKTSTPPFSPLTPQHISTSESSDTNSAKDQHWAPGGHGNVTPPTSQSPATHISTGKIAMLDDIANLIKTAIPWDRFTKKYKVDGERFEREVLTPLMTPLYQAASGDLDQFIKALTVYHVAKRHSRNVMERQERRKARQEARELREYENMRAKERWQVRKQGHKRDMADMNYDLARIKNIRSLEYRVLNAAIRRRKAIFANQKARRQEEKQGAKVAWDAKEAEVESVWADNSDDNL
ncbi:MAG: hypothetical protein Q9166_002844 [cf. Caloplaca sp. 2 TL-2023]